MLEHCNVFLFPDRRSCLLAGRTTFKVQRDNKSSLTQYSTDPGVAITFRIADVKACANAIRQLGGMLLTVVMGREKTRSKREPSTPTEAMPSPEAPPPETCGLGIPTIKSSVPLELGTNLTRSST
ncbi:hypothetical protein HanRHA438_Chr04g0195441 [Helianthus annuus]|nr:hypothetical protein HanRHA438_Chr04g0195441 [Helianthus annuus]